MINEKKALRLSKKSTLSNEETKELKEFILECNNKYYNEEEPLITDKDWDYINSRYTLLTGEEIIGADAPSNTVSESHKYPFLVGTLAKAMNMDEFIDWLKKLYKQLGKNPKKDVLTFYINQKFDGNSIVCEYDADGKLVRALTRGKNGKGKDVTKAFKDLKIDNYFECPLGIKYEALIKYSKLEELNEAYNKEYKNPRNTISGLINGNSSANYKNYYLLEPLWMEFEDGDVIEHETETEFYNHISEYQSNKDGIELGNESVEHGYYVMGTFDDLVEGVKAVHDEYVEERKEYDYMIDGMVIMLTDLTDRNVLGYQDGGINLKPKWAVALKFPYMEEESIVTDIKFSVGNSGKITPVCHFETVVFNGNDYTKQSLQNYLRFKELNLGKGSRIKVALHNDTLTYIEKMPELKGDKKIEPIPFIKNCPICGEKLKFPKNGEAFVYCTNDLCSGRSVGRINNYIKKLDIKGIDRETIEKLYEAKLWLDIPDIYNFNLVKAYKVEGLGKTSVDKMHKAIEAKVPFDYEILGGIGIKSLGLDTAKSIIKGISLEEILNLFYNTEMEEFIGTLIDKSHEGVGEIMANHIYKWLSISKNLKVLKFLIERGYKEMDVEGFDDVSYTFVVTGDLVNWDRGTFKRILESKGHKLTSSVSNKTDYLITNDKDSGTVKNKKATELGKPIIDESEVIELLHLEKYIEQH